MTSVVVTGRRMNRCEMFTTSVVDGDLRAGNDSDLAVGDDRLAAVESRGEHRLVADRRGRRRRARICAVPSGRDDEDVASLLPDLDRRRTAR